jgi:hypothetical protein
MAAEPFMFFIVTKGHIEEQLCNLFALIIRNQIMTMCWGAELSSSVTEDSETMSWEHLFIKFLKIEKLFSKIIDKMIMRSHDISFRILI